MDVWQAPEASVLVQYGPDNTKRFGPEKMVVIDQPFMEVNTPMIRHRLVKAGIRLGG